MAKPLIERITLDDVLANFSVRGRYHAVSALLLILGMMYNAICSCNYVFVAEEVAYRCVENSSNSKNGVFNISDTQNSSKEWNTGSCSEWVYDNPDTFVAEFQLAGQEWKRTLIGTVHSFGYMIGLLMVGPLSDRYGRKPLAIATGVAGAVCGLTKSFVTVYWLYVALEFLEGAIGDAGSPLYMLAIEMVAPNSRVAYTTACNMGFPLGGMLFPLIAWQVPYWRTFLRVAYTPGFLFLFLIKFIDESPRWLLTKGKTKAAVKIINDAAKFNKISIQENLDMLSQEQEEGSNFMKVLADTFKSKSLVKRFFVCTTWWTAATFVNYGLTINSVNLEGNKYVNYALAALMEIPSNFLVMYLMNKFNRRGPLIMSFLACTVFCAGQPFIPKNLLWLIITMYMIGKLVSVNFFSITYIYTSELFPTHTRNAMHALCSSMGRIGSMLAPQTPLLMVYWSGLPSVLFGAVALIAALATLLVPDTAQVALPDTVRQAEALDTLEAKSLTEDSSLRKRHNSTNL